VAEYCECGNETAMSIKCGNVAFFLPGRAKELSASQHLHLTYESLFL